MFDYFPLSSNLFCCIYFQRNLLSMDVNVACLYKPYKSGSFSHLRGDEICGNDDILWSSTSSLLLDYYEGHSLISYNAGRTSQLVCLGGVILSSLRWNYPDWTSYLLYVIFGFNWKDWQNRTGATACFSCIKIEVIFSIYGSYFLM